MRFWVGITDGDWFDTPRRLRPDEVNFWRPSDRPPRTVEPGWPFLFKLHSPRYYIVGGGFFVRFTVLPCFLAWETFGEKKVGRAVEERLATRQLADSAEEPRLGEPYLARNSSAPRGNIETASHTPCRSGPARKTSTNSWH